MNVSVIVPYRPDGAHRSRSWEFLKPKWGSEYPSWEIVEGDCPDGPWVKARAVEDALMRATGDVLVIADADVWVDGVSNAVDSLGAHRWAVPHTKVHRLTESATQEVLAGQPIDSDDTVERPYTGVLGGGIVVIRRSLYEQAPFDPRFEGWGGEDVSAALAWYALAGSAWRGFEPLWHLWHPPSYSEGRQITNRPLFLRYRQAARNPAQMKKIIAEFKGVT